MDQHVLGLVMNIVVYCANTSIINILTWMIYALMDSQLTLDICSAAVLLYYLSSPSMAKTLRLPKLPRRLWSERLQPDTGVEASFGAWENVILGKAARLGEQGFSDLEDRYYMHLFRMSKASFNELYDKYGYLMQRKSTNCRQSIPGQKRMAVFLAYLAHGHKQQQLGILFDISQPVVSNILADGRRIFKKHMVPDEIQPVSGSAVRAASAGFEAEGDLPGCIGAVDGTFFHINQPSQWGDSYWCYKRMYGILVLAVCTADMLFTYVHAGSCGSMGDAAVWNMCQFKNALVHGVFDAPAADEARTLDGTPVLSYVVADAAFALHSRVMKAYDEPQGCAEKECFNYAVVRTRRMIENAFGRLKQRWNVCVFNRISDPELARDIALICCALHNWCEKRSRCMYDEWAQHVTLSPAEQAEVQKAMRRVSRKGKKKPTEAGLAVREVLTEHVVEVMQQRKAKIYLCD